MKKIIKNMLLVLCTFFITTVYAEDLNDIIWDGIFTVGNTIKSTVTCKDEYKLDGKCNVNYQWYTCNDEKCDSGEIIDGETASEYTIEESCVGKYLKLQVQYVSSDNPVIYEVKTLYKIVDSYVIIDNESKYSIDMDVDYGVGSSLKMKLNTDDSSEDTNEEIDYYVYFKNSADSNAYKDFIIEKPYGCQVNEIQYQKIDGLHLVTNGKEISLQDDWYLFKGYTYAYVIKRVSKEDRGYCYISKDPIEVKKTAIPDYGNRYNIFLFDESTDDSRLDIFPLYPFDGENGSHQMYAKIGKITDGELLKKTAKIEDLIDYANKNDGKEFKFSDNDSFDIDISDFKIENGAYYYIYVTYINTDGLYRDFSDAIIAKGENDYLVYYTPDDYDIEVLDVEEPKEEPKKEETPKVEEQKEEPKKEETKKKEKENPKTGVALSIVGVSALVIGAYTIIKYTNKNNAF